MKKNKIFIAILTISLLVGFASLPVFASEDGQHLSSEDYTYQIVGDTTLIDGEGNYMVFESKEKMNEYLTLITSTLRACLPGDPGYPNCDSYVPTTSETYFISSVNYNEVFMGYNKLTPIWSKAASYELSVSARQTFSQSLSYDDIKFGVEVSLEKGVKINIPANSSKDSRLGITADIFAKKYKVVIRNANTGAYINEYYYVTPTVTNVYNRVIYK